MFDDWKAQTNLYIRKHINRKAFQMLAGELDADIAELSDHYTAVLLANGVIDESGSETGLDFDEDDLLEAMLDRVPDSLDKREGSMIQTALGAGAYALEEFYLELNQVQVWWVSRVGDDVRTV